ncbi:MAG TPA: F0F1 ATP synthase subunit B [Planctomycetaceae bacterium]|nr:F0F1 ATP synthase subunit B [Planctomycetaceae bacterium]
MSRLLGCVLGCLFGCLLVGFAAPVSAEDAHPPAAAGHGDESHGEQGVPMNFKTDLALWSLVTFVAFCFVLNKVAWGPLKQGLDQREAGIRKEIADAQAANAKAAALLREHEAKLTAVHDEVKAILAEARKDAEHTKQDIVATAQREAEDTRKRAVQDIEQAKNTALTELFEVMSVKVVNAAERVLERSLSGEDHERLVTQALSEMNVRRN